MKRHTKFCALYPSEELGNIAMHMGRGLVQRDGHLPDVKEQSSTRLDELRVR